MTDTADMVEKVAASFWTEWLSPDEKRTLALAAIRTLAPMVEAKDQRIAALEAQLAERDAAARERDALRDRWVMIDQLRRDEGCSVEIIHDNPDPGGSNCAIYVTDNFGQDYSTYYGDTIDDCLKQAVAARAALKGDGHDH